jgi:uncharacterized protein DUF4440
LDHNFLPYPAEVPHHSADTSRSATRESSLYRVCDGQPRKALYFAFYRQEPTLWQLSVQLNEVYNSTRLLKGGQSMPTRSIVFLISTVLSCLALSVTLRAQAGGDVTEQIKQMQQESRTAQMKNDVSWAQQHLADGFVAGDSWGEWETKEDFVKDLQNKTNKWKSGDVSDVQVATFGSNTAVSHYKFTYDAEIRGTHRARTVICSDTWINDSGTWKTASTHCSMVKGK